MTTDLERPPTRDRLPLGVYLLAASLFAMGSAEFLMAGVLPDVAADLGVGLARAGTLITAFALGVVVGGPPFAVLSLRWPRRTALVATQATFAASIALGLLGGYGTLVATRFVAGLAYAGFFAVAAVTAVGLVGPLRRARASAVVVSGLSLAMVLGGPAGTLLAGLTGWRGGFWAVVVLTVVAAIACAAGVPRTASAGRASVRRELATVGRPRLWAVLLVVVLTTAAYMVTYNYLAALLREVTGLPRPWVAPVLVLFGVGAFVGLSVGGRVSDRRPHAALLAGCAGIAACSVVLAAGSGAAWLVVPVVLLLGVGGFVLNPALYARAFEIAADAPTLAGACTVSAFQLGISATPALAALVLDGGPGLAAVPLVGAALAVLAVPLVLLDRR